MAAEFSANAVQLVPQNGSVIFTATPVSCNRGLVFHRDESGLIRLASPSTMGYPRRGSSGCCGKSPRAIYLVSFHANIAVPEDPAGTVEPISLALAVDGEIDPSSTMIYTPAAVGDFGNVGAAILVEVPWICRCASVSVRNTSTQAIEVQNANLIIDFAGVRQ